MSTKRSLQAILVIALFGLAFSGYLTYQELFATAHAASCPSIGQPGTVLGYPACVYGFFMYLIIAGVAAVGLLASRSLEVGDRREGPSLTKTRSNVT